MISTGVGGTETMLAHVIQMLGHGVQLAHAGDAESVLRSVRKAVSAGAKTPNLSKQTSTPLTTSGRRGIGPFDEVPHHVECNAFHCLAPPRRMRTWTEILPPTIVWTSMLAIPHLCMWTPKLASPYASIPTRKRTPQLPRFAITGRRFLERLCEPGLVELPGTGGKQLSFIGGLLKLLPSLQPMHAAAVEKMLDMADAFSSKVASHPINSNVIVLVMEAFL